jgi:hypothetical protein
MRLFKKTFLLVFLFIGIACSRSQGDSSVVNNTSEKNSKQLQESESIQEIDSNSVANDSVANSANTGESQAENKDSRIENQAVDNWNKPNNARYSWWMISAIISLVITVILFLLLRKTMKSIKKYKREKSSSEADYNRLLARFNESINKKNELFRENQSLKADLKRKINLSRPDQPKQPNESVDDEKAPEVVWSGEKAKANHPQQNVKKSVNLYAEKATEDSIFSNVSDQKNDHKSIFKLTLEEQQAKTAQFEVLNSDYILKLAVNSPDTYLYTVCKPENSNQNFAGEIITVQKGIAHKLDGKWQVKDENKAKIKFQ